MESAKQLLQERVSEGNISREKKLEAVMQKLACALREGMIEASKRCWETVGPPAWKDSLSDPVLVAGICLWYVYHFYDDYDLVIFPIIYGTEMGETDIVEIIRISPQDAPSLINENDAEEPRRKLAGTAFFHFGGFLSSDWRKNDILWGRLDAAERILTTLLPNHPSREVLIEKAQWSIVQEEFPSQYHNLSEFRKSYEVERNLDPELIFSSFRSAVQVVGKILRGLVSNVWGKRLIRVMTWLICLLGVLVRIALPNSKLNWLYRCCLTPVYLIPILFLFLGKEQLQAVSGVLLGCTFLLDAIIVTRFMDKYSKHRC